jgi:hypothetical protein
MIEPPKVIELEFRDGRRQVPEYVAALLADVETFRLTYDQSIAEANRRMGADYANAAHERVLAAHFKEHRRWE